MTKLTTNHLGIALAAAAALSAVAATPAAACAQEATQRVDTTFAFEKNGWVDVTIVTGTVVITGWTRPEARVIARTERGLFEPTLTAGRIGLTLRSDRSYRGDSRYRLGPATVEISVPIGTRVMATAVSGDVRVRGTAAEVQANTTSGAIEVADAADRVVVRTTSGDIRLAKVRGRTRVGITSGDIDLDDITGSLEVNSVSSDMRIRRVDVTDLRIGTTSGDITFDGMVDPRGTYEITSHSGDVRFELPGNAGAVLSLQTYSGDIDSSFPMTLMPGQDLRRSRGRRMEFTVGTGGARVAITTFSGNIIIVRGPARTPREE